MEKASQLLTALQKQSEKQNESISQLHEQNLESLNKSLTDLYSTKLIQIEKSIQLKNKTTLQNINHELEILRTNKIYKYIGITVVSVIIGVFIGGYLVSKKLLPWTVPTEMRYEDKNGKFIVNKKDTWTFQDSQKIIRIGD